MKHNYDWRTPRPGTGETMRGVAYLEYTGHIHRCVEGNGRHISYDTVEINRAVRKLFKSPSAVKKNIEGIRGRVQNIPWKVFVEAPFMQFIFRGDLDSYPTLVKLPAWGYLQELEISTPTFDQAMGNIQCTQSELASHLMLMLFCSVYDREHFALSTPEQFARDYGLVDPQKELRDIQASVEEVLLNLTSPTMFWYGKFKPIDHGIASAIETLRFYILHDPTPGWVQVNMGSMGVRLD